MTNVFSDQEEAVSENCCLVTDIHEGWPRQPVAFHKHAHGSHQMTHFSKAEIVIVLGPIVPSGTDRAALVGPFQAWVCFPDADHLAKLELVPSTSLLEI